MILHLASWTLVGRFLFSWFLFGWKQNLKALNILLMLQAASMNVIDAVALVPLIVLVALVALDCAILSYLLKYIP